MAKKEISLNSKIYSARLMFIKDEPNKSRVIIKIDYSPRRKRKKLSYRKTREFIPENLNIEELSWTRYQGKRISVYHRQEKRGQYSYFDSKGIKAPTNLEQKLEQLVLKTHSKLN